MRSLGVVPPFDDFLNVPTTSSRIFASRLAFLSFRSENFDVLDAGSSVKLPLFTDSSEARPEPELKTR